MGGGEQLNLYPPHLNPLPPGERRYFLAIQFGHWGLGIGICLVFVIWNLGFYKSYRKITHKSATAQSGKFENALSE